MATKFDLEEKDTLDLIIKNKLFVRHLRENGIDGFEVNKILRDSHGLKSEIPISISKQEAAAQRQINYAMRWTKNLISNQIIEDEEIKFLVKIYNRLYQAQRIWEKGGKGGTVIKWKLGEGEGKAKSFKQMIGLRIVSLYKYIKPFCRKNGQQRLAYIQTDIFKLIAELFKVAQQTNFTDKQIKTFYNNNK